MRRADGHTKDGLVTFWKGRLLGADEKSLVPGRQDDAEADQVLSSIGRPVRRDVADECQEADSVRIESRIAELVDANPSRVAHPSRRREHAVPSAPNSAHYHLATTTWLAVSSTGSLLE